MIERYDWSGGNEAILRFGPHEGPVVVAALPLFEEANRTRHFVVTLLRRLAEQGVAGALPDLPGQGESLLPTEAVRLADLRAAFAGAVQHVDGPAYALGVRSGALVDATALLAARWHLTPVTGADLVRELERQRQAGGGGDYAGNFVAPALLSELSRAGIAAQARTVRLDSDVAKADLHVAGTPLWRRAEPGTDAELATRLAGDVATWVRQCAV
ncbi:hypothetical protein AB2M62_09870 [Sphingomonas sp. MMS12-HWE2-04]|uniref:hypothetical protein n=1 Tax=Sphingomonas sp. MMS12-HWE2-04 TaxID=3234199 RepID=UPI00384D8FF6